MNARKLPVLRTAVAGWRLPAADWSVLLRIVVPPLAVLMALDVYLDTRWERWLEDPAGTSAEYVSSALYILTTWDKVLALLFGGMIVALWHRARLTGPHLLSVFGLLAAWRNVAALTVLWCTLILITVGMTRMLSLPVGPWATHILDEVLIVRLGLNFHPILYRVLFDLILDGVPLLAALYVSGRLGLMLWARPAGGNGALDSAWIAGDGNGWRLAAAIFVAIMPVMILDSAFPPGPVLMSGPLGFHLQFDISNLLQLVIAVGVLAAAHGVLLGGDKATERAAPTDTPDG